jgi:hypothetical protein
MNKLKNILIIILFGVILFQSFFRSPPEPEYITKTDTVTISHDSIRYVPKPYPVYHDTGSYHAVPVYITNPTDTAAIIADYIQKIAYSDTLLNDSTAFILIRDTLQYNRIRSRSKIIRIHTYNKTLTIPPRPHFFAGIGVGGGKNMFGFTGNIGLQTKRGKLYTASYDVLNKTIFLSMYWKIK